MTSVRPAFAKLRIILDLSRLLSRLLHPTPTGVDRVEMAYARGLLKQDIFPLEFAAVHPLGIHGLLPRSAALAFLDAIEDAWENHDAQRKSRELAFALYWSLRLLPKQIHRHETPTIYIQASPNNFQNPELMRRIIKRTQSRLVCMVHDLIPLEYPEYARADGAEKHARRIGTVVDQADGILVNSYATLASLEPWLVKSGRNPLTAVAHLGTNDIPIAPAVVTGDPYFICVGTIEPRKNHLLLLNLWRAMAEKRDAAAIPKLIIVGRRGWENEQIVDMLERCSALNHCVEERGRVGDQELRTLLAGARGLLMPSFAEGYGMPVSEAIAVNVPVICSDLPALREAGGDIPAYLDPLDGPGWMQAIDDLSRSDSQLATRQAIARQAWSAPTWEQHIAILLDLLHRVAS